MRSGNTIFLEDVLDEAVRRAKLVVQEKVSQGKTELTPDEIEKVSEAVGIGALLYYDLHQDTARNIYFDWDEMLALQGNSAPYLQFMYARCASILRKAEPSKDADYSLLSTPQEQALLKQLTHFPKMVLLAAQRMSPSQVAISLYSIACAFSDFYNACSVLEAPDAALRDARLGLVAATAQCIKKGLSLLGIQSLEKM
jgi:arginyl-tRNA synthetase